MQIFSQEHIGTHCAGAAWPDMLGTVNLGEHFVVETVRFNGVNGPITVAGVHAGESIAVHLEEIEILPPFEAPNGGPFFEGMGDPVALEYVDGHFVYPGGLRLPASPSVGNVGVLPAPTGRIREMIDANMAPRHDHNHGWRSVMNDPRGKHCHQDCQYLTAGSKIHLRAQVDGAGLCLADVHGYISQGELAFAGIEVAANVQLRVERSTDWLVDWPLIETQDEIMISCSNTNLLDGTADQEYVDVVREAYRAMREVVAAKIGGTIEDANPIVATALDIRNCALYGLGNLIQKGGKTEQPDGDVAIVGALPKDVLRRAIGTAT